MIAQDIGWQCAVCRSHDQMHVVGHNDPGVQLQPFMLTAMAKTVYQDHAVVFAAEDIHPTYGRIGHKMHGNVCNEFVLSAHEIKVIMSGKALIAKIDGYARPKHATHRARLHACASGDI